MRQHYNKQFPKGLDIKLPIEFFADKKNEYLRPELLSDDAKELSDFFVSNKNEKMSIHQLRKFYHQLLAIKQKIEIDPKNKDEEFKRQLPYIRMLKAYAHYAKSRGNVTNNFCNFMEKQIDTIKDISDFNAFCDLFEAIVAFATANNRYKKNR